MLFKSKNEKYMRKILTLLTTFMLVCVFAFAQTRNITGQVMDENGNPVPFATVTQTGTKTATAADASGKFSLKITEGGTLTITAAGFTAKTVTPTGNGAIVTLARGEKSLEEVVVTTALGV